MRAPLALMILLLLAQFPSVEASPLGLEVKLPQWVDESSEFNLTIRVSGAGADLARLKVSVLREGVELTRREVSLSLPEEISYIAIRMGPLGEPGAYVVRTTVSTAKSTASSYEDLYVAPSIKSVLQLTSKLLEVDRELDRVSPILRDSVTLESIRKKREETFINFGSLVKHITLKENSKEVTLLFKDVSESIDLLASELASFKGYETFLWSALSPLDSSLKLPPETKFFWIKILPAFLLLLALLILLFPIYATDYTEVTLYLAEEDGRLDEEEESLMVKVRRRASRLFEAIEREIRVAESPRNYFLLILASLLAAVGLMTNNLTAIIGSTFLSALMSVIIASSMSLAVHEPNETRSLELFYRGFKDALLGILVVVSSSILISLIGSSFIPLQVTSEIAVRSSPNLADLMIAVCAGTAGSLSMIHRGEVGVLVASAAAIALVPPAAAVGISVVLMDPSLFSGALFLLTINVIALIASGYLTAKVHVMMPILKHMLAGAEGQSLGLKITSFLISWARAIVGLAGGRSLGESLAGVMRRISSLALLPTAALLLAVLITTDFPALVSSTHSEFLGLISSVLKMLAPSLTVPKWAPALLSSFTTVLSSSILVIKLSGFRKRRSYGSLFEVALLSVLLWLSLGYVLGIHLLSSIAAVFTIFLASAVLISLYKPLWKAEFALKLFLVLTFTVLLVNSASIFSEMSVRQKLYSSEFIELSRVLVSSYTGVLPEDVTISFEGSDRVLATIKVDLMKLEVLRDVKGIESLIESSLREVMGREVKVSVEFVVKPA
ncbi:MAG: DUF389 domain-containing protein [Candidatus Korarchaeum sp.]|nr:DUF389 domain-containing protein [Candidatus Korarchaeum sp.]MDW8035792.1 DUF389 domain-containing protein [Candidatus Korarchaeum sp.]